jgi:hypothetical protein
MPITNGVGLLDPKMANAFATVALMYGVRDELPYGAVTYVLRRGDKLVEVFVWPDQAVAVDVTRVDSQGCPTKWYKSGQFPYPELPATPALDAFVREQRKAYYGG